MTNYSFSWHCGTQAVNDLAHCSHTCFIPQDASPTVIPSPLTCSLTCWNMFEEPEPLRSHRQDVLPTWPPSICLSRCMVVRTLDIAQKKCLDRGHSGTLLMIWDRMYLASERRDSLSLKCFLSTDQDQRLKAKTITSLPLRIPGPIVLKHQLD